MISSIVINDFTTFFRVRMFRVTIFDRLVELFLCHYQNDQYEHELESKIK